MHLIPLQAIGLVVVDPRSVISLGSGPKVLYSIEIRSVLHVPDYLNVALVAVLVELLRVMDPAVV